MSEQTTYKYRNITISGLPGGGSTTLLSLLKEELKFEGWKGFSGGEFMRSYAVEKGLFDANSKLHHSAAHYEDDFDRKIDFGMREKLEQEEKWIIESWLSGFLAQGLDKVLKVLVYCSDDAIRIDRIVNRDQVSVTEAKKHIQGRYQANLEKWSRMYQSQWHEWVVDPGKVSASDPIDFWRPDLYDLVIDTYSTNKEETLQKVLHAIKA
jgi:cytidylate kinase